jgi:hypothetical protein
MTNKSATEYSALMSKMSNECGRSNSLLTTGRRKEKISEEYLDFFMESKEYISL